MDNQKRELDNKTTWESEIRKNVMLYPNERVVSFLAHNFPNIETNRNFNALDIGFGGGRHLKLLLDYNFQTYGIDYVQHCADVVRKILGKDNNLRELVVDDFTSHDFGETQFDVVILWGSIFLRPKKEMCFDLDKISSLLKNNGKVVVNFRTKDNSHFKDGVEIVKDETYILKTAPYENMTYTFLDIDDVKSIMNESGFTIDKIERDDYYKNNLTEKHSWWIINATKLR